MHNNDIKNEFFRFASQSSSIPYVEEVYENRKAEHLFPLNTNNNIKSLNSVPILSKEKMDHLFSVGEVKCVPNELKKIQTSEYPIQEWFKESQMMRSSIKKSQDCLMKKKQFKGKILVTKRSSSISSLQTVDTPKHPKVLREINVIQEGQKILVKKIVPITYSKIDGVLAKEFNSAVRIESEEIAIIEQQHTNIELQEKIIPEIQIHKHTEEVRQIPKWNSNDEGIITSRDLESIMPILINHSKDKFYKPKSKNDHNSSDH